MASQTGNGLGDTMSSKPVPRAMFDASLLGCASLRKTVAHYFSRKSSGRLTRPVRLGALCVALAMGAQPASAVTQFQKSHFITIERKGCKIHRAHPDGNAYICPGLPGYPVYLAEGDERTFVAASTIPEKSAAATQTLKAFNSPFRSRSERATVEFRFTIKENRKIPFAMIVRYFTQLDGRKGEVLVVSRIAGKEACHIGYVDALANDDAIVLARKLADDRARSFDCAQTAKAEGSIGKSPM